MRAKNRIPVTLLALLVALSGGALPVGSRSAVAAPGHRPSAPVSVICRLSQADWPYRFTRAEKMRLQRAGFLTTRQDLALAQRMARRGFSAAQFVAAVEKARRLGLTERRFIEAVAVCRVMGLDPRKLRSLSAHHKSLTLFYNQEAILGRKLELAGWITFGAGLALTVVGAGVLHIRDCSQFPSDPACSHNLKAPSFSGWTLIIVGIVAFVVGLPMGAVGTVRKKHRIPEQLLDQGTVEDLRLYKLHRSLGRRGYYGVSFRLAPSVSHQGGSLTLKLRF